MRILIISTFFPPQNSIASLRPYSFAKFWSERGHQVEVLTTEKINEPKPLDYPLDFATLIEAPLPVFFNRWKRNYHDGITAPSTPSRGLKSFLKKGIDYLRFQKGVMNACRMPDIADLWAIKAYPLVKRRETYDVVLSSCGPYATHLIAWRLKRAGAARFWVADYRDTWSDNYIYPGVFPFSKVEQVLERKMLLDADLITTISDPFADALGKKHGKEKTITVENGFDGTDLASLPAGPFFPQDGKLRIVHTGSIYMGKRDPTPLLRAIRLVADENPALLERLEVLFYGQRNADLALKIEQFGVDRWVRLAGFISRTESLVAQRDADFLLFLPWSDASVEGVLTGKLFEYLYSKTPIISAGTCPLDSAEKRILALNAGEVVKGEAALAAFLTRSLKKEKIPKVELGDEALKRFSRKEIACTLLSIISRKMKEKS
ncbi:glycosyltransferase [Estrella lausannensis]|uniref:Uncharacterized protein n=1 Tax=Estrella lausannensis TaxID=483423 RepID=A0A0H5DQ60_9BACT|nr:glycosyltransferase [Estrella lausannensis]CRX38771.1 hypothetical protein ELAC_1435 [Estrella lausannensis]